jgi:mannose-1-phosphate guanylyltransferase
MEKSDNVYVLPCEFGWSDLGTWGSLYDRLEKDENENAVAGKKVRLYDSANCVVNAPADKLVVLQGLNDYIVVESDNALLVCQKENEQKIKQFVKDLKLEFGEQYV